MTFGEMRTWLSDRLGATGEQNLIQQCLNRGKDRFCAAQKWWFLEDKTDFPYLTSTSEYTLGTNVASIVHLADAAGQPIDRIERDTYDEVYRADTTTTAAAPKVYSIIGAVSTTQALKIRTWPSISAWGTGSVHFQKRVSNLGTTDTSNVYDHIPFTHHFAILDFAEAELLSIRSLPDQAAVAEQKAMANVEKLASEVTRGQVNDRT